MVKQTHTRFLGISLVLLAVLSLPLHANERQAFIQGAMSGAAPIGNGDSINSSTGANLKAEDFLPTPSETEKKQIDDAKSQYGDDGGLLGTASDGNRFLASDGKNTSSGQAFDIVNQPLGFTTTIEHKIYQHEVLFTHDVASPLTTGYPNYLGVAWVDVGSGPGSESGGGPGFFSTNVPGGKQRNLTVMFGAPVKFQSCERAEVKITGGTAWVPGCSSGGANCVRTIANPESSSMFRRWGVYESRYWRWLNNDGSELSRMPNSEGGINTGGPTLALPVLSENRSNLSLAAFRNKYGVRKVEASGLCPHPSPSDDPYYIETLPACDDPSLEPGQECGKVTRIPGGKPPNPFGALDLEGQLNAMTSDCQMVTEDVSQEVTFTKEEREYCTKTIAVKPQGCAVYPHATWKPIQECGNKPGDGCWDSNKFKLDQNWWSGGSQCDALISKIQSAGSACSYNISQDPDPNQVTLSGKTFYKNNSFMYTPLSTSPYGGSAKTTPVHITDIVCDASVFSGEVSFGGVTDTVEEINTCGPLESNNKCTLLEEECVMESDGTYGDWCSQVDRTYSCETEIKKTISEEQTKMVCGNQEIYCKDGSCLDAQETLADEGFVEAAAMLSAVQGIGSHTECSDPNRAETCRVFNGKAQACRKGRGKFQDLWNCCDLAGGKDMLDEKNYVEAILDDGAMSAFIGPNVAMFFDSAKMILQFLMPCNDSEIELATSLEIDAALYLGSYCGKKMSVGFSKICIRRDRSYCAWPTTLGKVIMSQAKNQVGGGFGSTKNPDCKGLTIDQLQDLDWNQIDLTEWANKLLETDSIPSGDFDKLGDDPSAWTPTDNPGNISW